MSALVFSVRNNKCRSVYVTFLELDDAKPLLLPSLRSRIPALVRTVFLSCN